MYIDSMYIENYLYETGINSHTYSSNMRQHIISLDETHVSNSAKYKSEHVIKQARTAY